MLQQCGTLIILCHVTASLNHLALGARGGKNLKWLLNSDDRESEAKQKSLSFYKLHKNSQRCQSCANKLRPPQAYSLQKKGATISLAEASMRKCAFSNSLWSACIVTQIHSPRLRSLVYFYHQPLWQMLKQRRLLKDLICHKKKTAKKNKTKTEPRINFSTFHLFWIWCCLLSVIVRGWGWMEQVLHG